MDLGHLAGLVDERTKLVCVTGASNFLGSKPPLPAVRAIADASGYRQPSGERRSLLLVDAAQLAPSTGLDVRALDVDYLAFSFHKLLAPFGVGVLYAKQELLQRSLPFLYGGDMIAEGQVTPDHVAYNELPWKFSAGTPNVLGVIVSAQALRLVLDLVTGQRRWFGGAQAIPRAEIVAAMQLVGEHTRLLTERLFGALVTIPGLRIHGPGPGRPRSPLLAFTVAGIDPMRLAMALNDFGVEARAGCHCATLAHHELGLSPPASCRLSLAFYNNIEDVDRAAAAVRQAVQVLSAG